MLSYNIQRGGVGRERALQRVILRCRPDLVVFQEATRPSVIEQLAEGTGMPNMAAAQRQSLAFMSRIPVDHYEWHRPRFSRHAFLEIGFTEMSFRVFGVHLSAVHAAWTERRRAFELRALLKSIARHQSGFHALAGDFNTLAPGELLDVTRLPRRLRALVWISGGRVRFRHDSTGARCRVCGHVSSVASWQPWPDVSDVGPARTARLRVRAGRSSRAREVLRGDHGSRRARGIGSLSDADGDRSKALARAPSVVDDLLDDGLRGREADGAGGIVQTALRDGQSAAARTVLGVQLLERERLALG